MKVASNHHLLNVPLTKSFCCYHTRKKLDCVANVIISAHN